MIKKMPGPKKVPEGKRFKKGQSGNPLGAALHNQDLKKVRRLTHEQVAEVGSMILEGNIEGLESIRQNEDSSVLKVWFASVAMKAIMKGDANSLSVVLDRIVGKVKTQVEVESKADLSTLIKLSYGETKEIKDADIEIKEIENK